MLIHNPRQYDETVSNWASALRGEYTTDIIQGWLDKLGSKYFSCDPLLISSYLKRLEKEKGMNPTSGLTLHQTEVQLIIKPFFKANDFSMGKFIQYAAHKLDIFPREYIAALIIEKSANTSFLEERKFHFDYQSAFTSSEFDESFKALSSNGRMSFSLKKTTFEVIAENLAAHNFVTFSHFVKTAFLRLKVYPSYLSHRLEHHNFVVRGTVKKRAESPKRITKPKIVQLPRLELEFLNNLAAHCSLINKKLNIPMLVKIKLFENGIIPAPKTIDSLKADYDTCMASFDPQTAYGSQVNDALFWTDKVREIGCDIELIGISLPSASYDIFSALQLETGSTISELLRELAFVSLNIYPDPSAYSLIVNNLRKQGERKNC